MPNFSSIMGHFALYIYINACVCICTCIFIYLFIGKLMRAFPLEDKDNIMQEISEQLCDLIQSGQGDISIFREKLVFLFNSICI